MWFWAWNWKTTVGVATKFQMSINLEASMWYASIKVGVRLMLLPASWHSMTIWKRGCFLYPWRSAPVERGAKDWRWKLEGRGGKKYKSLTLFTSRSVWMRPCWGAGKAEAKRRALIEAQRKHANAMILFSLPPLLGPSLIIRFHFLASYRYSLTFTTRVSVCWHPHMRLPLSDWPIAYSCPFPSSGSLESCGSAGKFGKKYNCTQLITIPFAKSYVAIALLHFHPYFPVVCGKEWLAFQW